MTPLRDDEIRLAWWRRPEGRAPLLELLAAATGRDVRDGDIGRTPEGRPVLRDGSAFFSVSHAGGWTAAGVGLHPLGIDIAVLAPLPELEDLAHVALAPRERDALQACAPADRERFFYTLWTRKEALAKALGTGLGGAPQAIDPLADPAWRFLEFTCIPGVLGAVATRLASPRIVSA